MKFTIQPFYESNPASVVNVPMDDERELGRIEKTRNYISKQRHY